MLCRPDICAELGDGSLIIGECKWGEPITYSHLEKLRMRMKSLMVDHDVRFALFSGRDLFSKELREASTRGEVMLIGPDELIQGEHPAGLENPAYRDRRYILVPHSRGK